MGVIWPVIGIAGLLVFGVVYNHLVGWMEHEGHIEGYVAIMVCVGVAFTMLGWGLITWRWNDVLLLLGCFVATGTPMVVGSVWRHMQARARDRAAEREALRKVLRGRAG
jgi:hypothetical protein